MTDYKLVPVELTTEMMEEGLAGWSGNDLSETDLDDMWRRMLAAAPAVQGEPVAWMTHHDEPMLFLAEKEAAAYCDDDERPIPLYAAPQPAEQQPAPDVAGLVEALTELCDEIDNHDIHSAISKTNILWFKRKALAALAAHRKGGES